MTAKKKPGKKKTNKTTVSAKQAKMVEDMRSGSVWAAVAPWAIGFFALLFGLCLLFPDSSGIVGKALFLVLRGMFSVGAYLVPILLLNIAVFWKRDRENGIRAYKGVFSALFLLFFSAFCGIFASPELIGEFSAKALWEGGKTLDCGGLFGSLVANALIAVLERAVTAILCGFVLIVSGCFLIGKTPAEIIRVLAAKARESRERAREYRESVAEAAEEAPLPEEAPAEIPAAEPEALTPGIFVPEDELHTPLKPDHTPDEEELAIPLGGAPDPDCEDITKLDPRFLKDTGAKGAVKEVFDTPTDPAVSRRYAEGDIEEAEREFEIDLTTKKAPEKKPPAYRFPPLSLLSDERVRKKDNAREIRETADKLVRTLQTFHVNTSFIGASQGPTVTRYELQPETGVRVKTIAGLADDIALHLAARDVRIEAPIPGREAVGIEVPNSAVSKVGIRELLEDPAFKKSDCPVYACLGMDVAGEHVYCDVTKMPHLLIAGATGSGKSVCINAFLTSILYKKKPEEVKLILIDPKGVELTVYNGIGHLLVPVVCDAKKAAGALNWAVNEMERRYSLIGEKGARNLRGYNEAIGEDEEKLSHIVIVIDELADLMLVARDSVETAICRLAAKARAAGIHLILGTQRPSVDVITGLIKSNIPSRIAFTVASQIDSRTILDSAGAEKLLGNGDMLYAPVGASKPIRVQGAFVSDAEVGSIVNFLKQSAPGSYSEETMADIEKEAEKCVSGKKKADAAPAASGGGDTDADDLFWAAVELALDNGGIATSLLQRRLSVGYARAARLIDAMEERGIVGPHNGAKPREIRITREEYLEMKASTASGDGEE